MSGTVSPEVELVPFVAPDAAERTPENTPLPGGGSWRWDYDNHCWVENVPAQTIHEE